MTTRCPYCDIEVSESSIEAEDGCCPECGSVITALSELRGNSSEYDEDDDDFDGGYDDDFDEDDDDDFIADDFEDQLFDEDEEFDMDFEDFEDDEEEEF